MVAKWSKMSTFFLESTQCCGCMDRNFVQKIAVSTVDFPPSLWWQSGAKCPHFVHKIISGDLQSRDGNMFYENVLRMTLILNTLFLIQLNMFVWCSSHFTFKKAPNAVDGWIAILCRKSPFQLKKAPNAVDVHILSTK